jgi:hypothetical protein
MDMFNFINTDCKKKNKVVDKDNWTWLKDVSQKYFDHKDLKYKNECFVYKYKVKSKVTIFNSFFELWSYVEEHWMKPYQRLMAGGVESKKDVKNDMSSYNNINIID